MKIARISTNGVRGLPDGTFDLTDPSSGLPLDFVLVTGPTSSGKTSLLDAIAAAKEDVAPYAARRSSVPYVRSGARAAKIKIDWWLSEAERGRVGAGPTVASESILSPTILPSTFHDPRLVALLSAYSHAPDTAKLEYFHEHRTLARGSTGSSALSPEDQRGLRLGKEIFKYAVLPRFLFELCMDGAPALDEFAKRFGPLCPTKRLGGLRKSYAGREVFFVDAAGVEVEVEDLSSGEQQAVIFAATSMFIGLNSSILLVDTPEKHIEGGSVVPFTLALSGLGTDNQLIIATGSRELVASATPQAVIRLGG